MRELSKKISFEYNAIKNSLRLKPEWGSVDIAVGVLIMNQNAVMLIGDRLRRTWNNA